MGASPYIARLRAKLGNGLILLPSVAASILDDQGRLLLQERADGSGWSLPAGAIEPGENPVEAVAREVLEETGYPVTEAILLGAFGGAEFRYRYPNGDEVEYTVLLYRCTIGSAPIAKPDAETASIRFFARDEMPRLALPYPAELLFARSSGTGINPV